MKVLRSLITIVGLPLGLFCKAQIRPKSISHIDSLLLEQPKPTIILLSTDWCNYCYIQKQQIRRNKDFIRNRDHFYYVEFDAESKEDIYFHDTSFKNVSGLHELAKALNGPSQLVFPTWVVLGPDYKVLFRYQGLMVAGQLKQLLDVIELVATN